MPNVLPLEELRKLARRTDSVGVEETAYSCDVTLFDRQSIDVARLAGRQLSARMNPIAVSVRNCLVELEPASPSQQGVDD